MSGAARGIRTPNLNLTRGALYRWSYRGKCLVLGLALGAPQSSPARPSTHIPSEALAADEATKPTRRPLIALFAALALAACASDPPASVAVLPPVKEYSAEFTRAFAAQLATIPDGSPVAVYIVDQQELRCAVRAARGDPLPSTCKEE